MRPLDLAYGRRLYDWWGRHPGIYRAFATAAVFLGRERHLRRLAVEALDVDPGSAVLDLGCGHGPNFAQLEDALGPGGRLVALDYSEGMLGAARRRAETEGWLNIEFLRTDAAHAELAAESLDGALCTLALSAIPDHQRAIAKLRAALRPGARFVVLDANPLEGPARLLNPLIKPLFRYTTNWDYERDLPAALRGAFGRVEVRKFNAGSLFLAVATKSTAAPERGPASVAQSRDP